MNSAIIISAIILVFVIPILLIILLRGRNTLLGSPRQLICQCCGMPLEDATTSREPDGAFNEEYCKWCYTDGTFKYTSPEQLIEFCVEHMASDAWPKEQVRAHMEAVVPNLKHWKK